MDKIYDLGDWTLLEKFTSIINGKKAYLMRLRCKCGKEHVTRYISVQAGMRQCNDCRNFKKYGPSGGKSTSREYITWIKIKQLCYCKTYSRYPKYGGRGIKMCDRWLKFENFYADMGDAPKGTLLRRINNDGDYEPNNCQWYKSLPKSRINY